METVESEVYINDDNKKLRWREVMSMLFGAFFQSEKGDWLITPAKIAVIFLGERDKKTEVIKIIDEKSSENSQIGIREGENIDIVFLQSIIDKVAQDKEDIYSFKTYICLHDYYRDKLNPNKS